MYTVQQQTKLQGKITTIYFKDKTEELTSQWTTDEREAKVYNTEQEAQEMVNLNKPTVKPKQ